MSDAPSRRRIAGRRRDRRRPNAASVRWVLIGVAVAFLG